MKSLYDPASIDYYAGFEQAILKCESDGRRRRIILEAYTLLGVIEPGENVCAPAFDRASFHLLALAEEYPGLNESHMAHRLARRLQLDKLTPSLWQRIRWFLLGNRQ